MVKQLLIILYRNKIRGMLNASFFSDLPNLYFRFNNFTTNNLTQINNRIIEINQKQIERNIP